MMLGNHSTQSSQHFKILEMQVMDNAPINALYDCIFIQILQCLRGLEYAIKLKWFDVRKFNLRDYEFYERVENGDLNWIVPGKFIAFSGPSATQKDADGVNS